MIVKNIPADERIAGGLLFRSPTAKEDMKRGEIVSLGTVIPPGYECLKLGLIIQYYGSQAIPITYDADRESKYDMIRVSDCTEII
jgi:co-chaperonin GroES (HSP10)